MGSADLMRGTVELLILRSLEEAPRHGYAIAEWIGAVTGREILVEEGTLYPALHRMAQAGLLASEWGVSDNNRRARYYALTRAGRRRLADQAERWERHARAVTRALAARPTPP